MNRWTESLSLDEFLSLLPDGGKTRAEGSERGVNYPIEQNPRFIAPQLSLHGAPPTTAPSLVLLSAPGAVGKSTLARELARRKGALRWDLAEFQVGQATLSGTLLKLFRGRAAEATTEIEAGRAVHIIDALDEAQVRAGNPENFDAFLTDLADRCKHNRSKPSLVLLGRHETAEWAHLWLEDQGVSLCRYEIDFFDQDQAHAFIDRWLDECGKNRLHRDHRQAYTEARTRLFDLIYYLLGVTKGDLWKDGRVRSFLGYAPVLEALAKYLDVTNYKKLSNDLESRQRSYAGIPSGPWKFLLDVTYELLDRERQKLLAVARPNLEKSAASARWGAWDSLYEPAEQCSRVLSIALKMPLTAKRGLPVSLSQPYEDSVRTFLPNHTFLGAMRGFANVVFEEFLYAWALIRGSSTEADQVRASMIDSHFLPSPLLGRFLVSLAEEDAGGAAARIEMPAENVGVLYESLLARNGGDDLVLEIYESGEDMYCVLSSKKDPTDDTSFLLRPRESLQFWRRLTNADVSVTSDIHLGTSTAPFLLGPDVQLHCGTLHVHCPSVDVDLSGNVALIAKGYVGQAPHLRLRTLNEKAGGRFGVSWPNVSHPWSNYPAEPSDIASSGWTLSARQDTFRKLILMFNKQRTRRQDTVTSVRWGPDQEPLRDELLQLAFDQGVLKKRDIGRYIILEFCSDFDSLKTILRGPPAPTEKALRFMRAFLASEADVFLTNH